MCQQTAPIVSICLCCLFSFCCFLGTGVVDLQHYLTRSWQGGEQVQRIGVAFSGGGDSWALLLSLQSWCKQRGIALCALHFDHRWNSSSPIEQLRTAVAAAQIEWIEGYDRAPQIDELHGRKVRYAWFEKVAKEHHISVIATAHHANDQAEWVLRQVMQGAPLWGLTGIQPWYTTRSYHGWRPYLPLLKEQLLQTVPSHFPIYDDPYNSDPRFFRSALRPLLTQLEGALGKRIVAPLQRLSRESQQLTDALHTTLTLDESGGVDRWCCPTTPIHRAWMLDQVRHHYQIHNRSSWQQWIASAKDGIRLYNNYHFEKYRGALFVWKSATPFHCRLFPPGFHQKQSYDLWKGGITLYVPKLPHAVVFNTKHFARRTRQRWPLSPHCRAQIPYFLGSDGTPMPLSWSKLSKGWQISVRVR